MRKFLLINDKVIYCNRFEGEVVGRNMHNMWIVTLDNGAQVVTRRGNLKLI